MTSLFRSSSATQVNPVGLVALAGIACVGAICAFTIPPVLELYRNPPKRVDAAQSPAKIPSAFNDAIALSVDRVDGRSLFFVPGPPQITKDDGPKATVYGGPALLGYVNGIAWFSDGQKLSQDKPEDRTLTLLKANPPWSVRVQWQGGEFDVELFKKIDVGSLRTTTNAFLKPGTTSAGTTRLLHETSGSSSGSRLSTPPSTRPAPGFASGTSGAVPGPGAGPAPGPPPDPAPSDTPRPGPSEPAPAPAAPPSQPQPGDPPATPPQNDPGTDPEPAPPSPPPASPETSKPS